MTLPDMDAASALHDPEKLSAWETCPSCNGSGLALNMAGEPGHCWECKGETVIRARDAKGRYRPNPPEARQ